VNSGRGDGGEGARDSDCDATGGVGVSIAWRDDPYNPGCQKLYLIVSNGWNASVVVDYAWQKASPGDSTWVARHFNLASLETRAEWIGNCPGETWGVSGDLRHCISFDEGGCYDRCGTDECHGQATCE